ncbi:MAG: DUF3102 domain-containing protein [Mesorhizobium sp.]
MIDYTPMHAHDVPGDLNLDDNIAPATEAAPIDDASSKKNLPVVIATNVATADDRYDYTGVSPEVAHAAREAATKIRLIRRGMKTNVIEIGRELLAIKAKLAHGQFGPWLHAEFTMSERSAQTYMNVARLFAKNEPVSVLPSKTIKLLARKGTPEKVVEEVIAAIANKKPPSHADVHLLIKKEKAALSAERKASAAANRAERETPEEADLRSKLAQQEEEKRQKKVDEESANESEAQQAADDAVQLLVDRLTKAQLLTFCQLLRLADYRFKASLDKAGIVTDHRSAAA